MIKKKKKNLVVLITLILFGIYLAIYFAVKNGYYEYTEYNKMVLTEEAMKRFEEDVAAGKDITINEYLTTTYKDYSNDLSNLGVTAGEGLEVLITEGMGGVIKVLSKLITD